MNSARTLSPGRRSCDPARPKSVPLPQHFWTRMRRRLGIEEHLIEAAGRGPPRQATQVGLPPPAERHVHRPAGPSPFGTTIPPSFTAAVSHARKARPCPWEAPMLDFGGSSRSRRQGAIADRWRSGRQGLVRTNRRIPLRHRRDASLGAILAVLLLVAACGSAATPTSAPSAATLAPTAAAPTSTLTPGT